MTTRAVFFDENLEENKNFFNISSKESHHIYKVQKKSLGQIIDIVNGKGLRVTAKISKIENGIVQVNTITVTQEIQKKPSITLVLGLLKNNYDELAIDQATQIGIDKIIAYKGENSVVNWGNPNSKKDHSQIEKHLEKWKGKLVASAKQSRQSFLPKLDYAFSISELIAKLFKNNVSKNKTNQFIIVMDENSHTPLIETLNEIKQHKKFDLANSKIVVIVGSEGGISPNENKEFEKLNSFFSVLPTGILRSSTASTVCVGMCRNFFIDKFCANKQMS